MELLVLIPAFLVFLYCMYRLVKDDYVFIRKNISLEQLFDIVFTILWIGLFFSRVFYFLFNPIDQNKLFFAFFSIRTGGFSLTGAVIGGLLALYTVGRSKRIPLGRLADFIILALAVSLPLGFLGHMFFLKKAQMLAPVISAFLYFILTIFFMKFLYPKIMSRTLKEGTLSILFLIFFSLASLFTSLIPTGKGFHIVTTQNIVLTIFFFFSLFLLVKQERRTTKKN